MNLQPILIVDDEPSMRMALSESLISCGYSVDTAIDGQDALIKLSKSNFKLVITDLRMPKLGGMEVLTFGIPHQLRVFRRHRHRWSGCVD